MVEDSRRARDALLMRARALCGAGRFAWYELDLQTARDRLEEALALFRQVGDQAGILEAMGSLIMVLSWQGENVLALSLVEEGMGIVQRLEDRQDLLPVLSNFGWAVSFTSAPETLDDSWNINGEVATLARMAGDKRGLAWALDGLGLCSFWRGDFATARPLLEESNLLFREVGELWAAAHTVWGLGNMAIEEGRYSEARAMNDDAMRLQVQIKNWLGIPYTLEMFAFLAIAEKQLPRAARLLGAAEQIREMARNARQPLVLALYERNMTLLSAMIPPVELQAAWAEGRAMTMEEAIEYSLQEEPDGAIPFKD